MKPHPRIRKTIKWTGAAVTVLLVVVWFGSGWIAVDWHHANGALVVVSHGTVLWGNDPGTRETTISTGWLGSSRRWRWTLFEDHTAYYWVIAAPIWPFIVVGVLTTATAWRLDTLARRRARLNLCPKCNYDRTGLAKDAVCPECGSKGGPA